MAVRLLGATAVYPVVIFDALRIKIRNEGLVKNRAVCVVLGINLKGIKEVLGLWVEQTEGAKFWMRVITDLRNRGVGDIPIAVVDGLKGFPKAILAIYPKTQVQTCIVHMVRHSLKFAPWKERKEVVADLKAIYRAETVEAAPGPPGRLRGPMGSKISHHRPVLSAQLG